MRPIQVGKSASEAESLVHKGSETCHPQIIVSVYITIIGETMCSFWINTNLRQNEMKKQSCSSLETNENEFEK